MASDLPSFDEKWLAIGPLPDEERPERECRQREYREFWEAARLLCRLEWADHGIWCQLCCGRRWSTGHFDDCPLARLLTSLGLNAEARERVRSGTKRERQEGVRREQGRDG